MAAEIKGHVYDKKTKEQIVGAYVAIKSLTKAGVTELDGDYSLKNLAPGTYAISCTYLGYREIDTTISITSSDEIVKIDFYLSGSSKELKEVHIKSKLSRESDLFANKTEQNADNIINVMSAHSIQISPDLTVSEVMQRISGVSMARGDGGQGQYAIIRGMDKRFNTTLINGVKIPSPDNKDRYVPLDMFPAELVERLEVIKTLTPSMEGDATGGSINMVMKNAPDKLMVDANFGLGYSSIWGSNDFQKYSTATVNWKSPAEMLGPNVFAPASDFPLQNLVTTNIHSPLNTNSSLTIGNRFFKDKLGIIISGSYQSTYDGYHANTLLQAENTGPSPDIHTNNVPDIEDFLVRQYSTLSNRLGTEAKIDYKINDKNTISLFGTYLSLDDYRVRQTIDSQKGGTSLANGWALVNGLHYRTETRTTLQNIYNTTLQGKHQITDFLSADWSLVTSEAKRLLPNDAQFGYDEKGAASPTNPPKYVTYGTPYVSGLSDEWQHNTDKDLAGYGNIHYTPDAIPFLKGIDIGVMYRHKDRSNYDNKYSLSPVSDKDTDIQVYTNVENSKFYFLPASGALGSAAGNAGIYTFNEDLLAYYAQAHINIGEKTTILGGARVENTQQSYNTQLPVTVYGYKASYNYIDILPSIQAKYQLQENGAIRASYFNSVNRPAYSDLVPYADHSANEYYPTQGNPNLLHSVIHNADIRYELFPKGLDEFMIGGFYKYVINPIEYGLSKQTALDLDITPTNRPNATNYGLELVARKFFGNFGISGNYTYTHSDVIDEKHILHYLPSGSTTYDSLSVHRPLQGQAANIGNFSLLYRNRKQQIEAQLALLYTGDRINTVSYYNGLDIWQKPTWNLDFSLQKQFGKHFIAYFKYKNILNTGVQLYIKETNQNYSSDIYPFQESPNYYTIEKDYYRSSILLGVRYKIF
ncbi:MAG TPA: TonB-dependent receptor [Flavipsychrobacter sp.]|nr:TonB-dependent receptor [Flavipsychrobacter sp.]